MTIIKYNNIGLRFYTWIYHIKHNVLANSIVQFVNN
jgi:hypothetical protein